MTEAQRIHTQLFGETRPLSDAICDHLRGMPTAEYKRKWQGHRYAMEFIRFERGI